MSGVQACGPENGPFDANDPKHRLYSAAQVAALVEQARREGAEAEREACAADCDCGCAARPDVLARFATDGHKRASYLCPHGDSCHALQAAAIRARGDAP